MGKILFPKKKEDNKKEVKTKKFFLKKMKKLGKVADPRKYETKNVLLIINHNSNLEIWIFKLGY